MNRILGVILLTLIALQTQAQITWTYSTRDAMTYSTGDTVSKYLKWRNIIDTTGGSPYRTLKGATAPTGQAVAGSSTLGAGARAGVYWDSTMASDTNSFSVVWKENEDSANVLAGSTFLYWGMNDTNVKRWKGLALKISRWNSGGINGGDYVFSFRKIDSTSDNATTGDLNLNSGGYALRRDDTIRVINLGGNLSAYDVKVNGTGSVLLDSSTYNAANSAYSFATGRMAIRMRVSPVPPMLNTFQIGTKGGSLATIQRDTIKAVLYGETQSMSTDSGSTFTLSFGAYDSNTTTQKNPGLDSMIIKFGTTFAVGNGGNPDTVVGDSLKVKCGTTKDTVVSKLFSKKSIGTYYFQFIVRDDSGNSNYGSRKTLVVGSATQNPFKVHGYFYQQTLSSWWPAIQATPSILGDLATNEDYLYWFYDNPDTVAPYLRIRIADGTNPAARFPAGSQQADSFRVFGYDRSGAGGRNIMYQFRDSVHAHGNKFILSISAITAVQPATAAMLSAIALDTTKSKGFASTLANFCNLHKFDGVDFNWEFPTQAAKASMGQMLKKIKDSLNAHSWNGQTPILSMGVENLTAVTGNQNYDITAIDTLCDFMTIESGARLAGAGNNFTSNPAGISHPTINTATPLPGDTVKGFDGYTYGDTTYQNGLTYVTSNGMHAAGLRNSKAVQILGEGVDHYTGTTGPGQPAGALGFSQLGETGGGSALQNFQDNYWSPLRQWRDSTNNFYVAYKDAGNVKHVLIYEDSVSIGQKAKMLLARGFSSFMYNEAAWLFNASGWRGNNDRLSFLHWMRVAANNAASFTTVGMPTTVSPVNGSTSQGSVSSGTVSVTFKWNKVSNANQGYHISLTSDPGFNLPVTGGDIDVGSLSTDTTVTIAGLASNTVHYWKVTGRMGRFYSYNSPVQRFTTATASSAPTVKPHKPILTAPANAATGQNTSLGLKWRVPSGVTDTIRAYYVQIGTDPAFASYFKYDSVVSSQSNINPDTNFAVSGLSQGATYYWHVKALNAVGDSGYSSNFSLSTSSASPVTTPSFAQTWRWFDGANQKFRNDAAPPMLVQDVPLSVIHPPRKSNGTLDTNNAWISARGIMFWDSSFYDFSKAGNYLLTQGNTWGAYQAFNGGLSVTNLSISGNFSTNLVPTPTSVNVGQYGVGTVAAPADSIIANGVYKVYQRNGTYVTDQYAIKSEPLMPASGWLLWEDFLFNGSAPKTVTRGNVVISAVGQNRWNVHAGSQATGGGGIVYSTPTPISADSNHPGMMAITLNGAGTLGTANVGAFSFRGDSTFGTINPRINGLMITGGFYIPATADSLGYSSGLAAIPSDSNKSFITIDSAKAGIYIEGGGKLTAAQQTTDSICAVASNGSTALRTKVKLITAVAGHWYSYQIWSYGTNAVYTIWSDIDNFTTPTTTTIVTNLPAVGTNCSPLNSAWNYDASTTKQIKYDYFGLFVSQIRR